MQYAIWFGCPWPVADIQFKTTLSSTSLFVRRAYISLYSQLESVSVREMVLTKYLQINFNYSGEYDGSTKRSHSFNYRKRTAHTQWTLQSRSIRQSLLGIVSIGIWSSCVALPINDHGMSLNFRIFAVNFFFILGVIENDRNHTVGNFFCLSAIHLLCNFISNWKRTAFSALYNVSHLCISKEALQIGIYLRTSYMIWSMLNG